VWSPKGPSTPVSFGWIDAFQHDLGGGRHLQIAAEALHDFGLRAAQQAGELVFGQRIRHRRHRAEDGRRVGAERHRHRERLAGMLQTVVAEIQRTAAMRQPAHDHLVRAITCWR
jgi:hypothetical protein